MKEENPGGNLVLSAAARGEVANQEVKLKQPGGMTGSQNSTSSTPRTFSSVLPPISRNTSLSSSSFGTPKARLSPSFYHCITA